MCLSQKNERSGWDKLTSHTEKIAQYFYGRGTFFTFLDEQRSFIYTSNVSISNNAERNLPWRVNNAYVSLFSKRAMPLFNISGNIPYTKKIVPDIERIKTWNDRVKIIQHTGWNLHCISHHRKEAFIRMQMKTLIPVYVLEPEQYWPEAGYIQTVSCTTRCFEGCWNGGSSFFLLFDFI